MNWTTIAIGLAMMAFGIVTAILRQTHPQKFRKLEPMKAFWGPRAGYWIHVFGYSVVPFVAGVITALSGARGFALFDG